MRKFLSVLVLFTPLLMEAQLPVNPILSPDYLSLIKDDSLAGKKNTAISPSTVQLRLRAPFWLDDGVKAVREKDGNLTILPVTTEWLSIGGNLGFSTAARSVNTQPSLQQQYVQGESDNGSLVYRAPETNELFSYGPLIQSAPYDNGILRTGNMNSQSLSLQANIRRSFYWNPIWAFSLKVARNTETIVLPDNRNTSHSFFTSVERHLGELSILGSYNYFSSRLSNDNSNGFLNRVYQNALLTPISFSNAQGAALPAGGQRAYSDQAANPLLLLQDSSHSADKVQQTGNLSLQKKQGNLTFGVISTIDAVKDNSRLYPRKQNDDHYTSNAYLSYRFDRIGDYISSTAKLNYIYNNEKFKIRYPADVYSYHRSSSDVSFTFHSAYDGNDIHVGLNAGNKFYLSNTSLHNKFFLPEVNGYIAAGNLFSTPLYAKLTANYTLFCSEPPINRSSSYIMMTQLAPQDASKFLPATEVRSFNDLSPMEHREFSSWVQLDYRGRLSLNADFSIRDTKNNVFPVYENNQLILKNLGDTRYKGFELNLQINAGYSYPPGAGISNKISFYKFSNTVTRVQDGYEGHPIAGFSTVYKALVKGQPVGAIMGSSYLQDANNNVLIGADGFPLMNSQPSIIGNPNPDFTLKFSHVVSWKAFTINIDWEYRKGGDIWNGTAAVLDYYGRSATTGEQRNITGYVFDGKLQNGNHNNIPVAFYDPALPVEQNRWVRYGYTGIAASYIEKGDNIRIHTLSLGYDIKIKKYLQRIRLTAYAHNLLLWSAYKGVDPNQLLYDQPASAGLDLFNLPSTKTFGAGASFQF
ncbi:MAG TPA: hypothetical protein VHD83_15465 [Puia sp.]|nr:hypothetical protein [Puia sp.]